MATSPLRLMPGNSPVRLMPGDDQVLADKYATDAAAGNSLTNSFTGALIGNQANLLADEESVLRAAGDPRSLLRADQLQSERIGLKARGRAYAAPVGRYEDVHSLGDAGSFVAGQLGQAAGSSVSQMATGVGMNALATGLQMVPHPLAKAVGTGLRWAAPAEMYRQNKNLLTGEAYDTVSGDPAVMANKSAQEIRDEVSLHGYRAAVMDTLPQMLPVGQVTGALGKTLKKVPSWGKLAAEAVGEGVTETGQQISQHFAHEALNPNRDTSGDLSENINSGIGGFIGGGGMGAVGHFGEKALDRARAVGDGKNGDALNLDGTPSAPSVPKPSVLETLNGKPSRFATSEEFAKLSTVLEGHPPEDPAAQEEFFMAGGAVRKNALLTELTKRQEPEAAALAAKVNAVDTDQPGSVLDPAFDEAGAWLAPKLHGEIKLKKNAQRISSSDLGGKVGGEGTAEFEKVMLHDGVRAKLNEQQLASAQEEVKLHGQNAKLLTDRLWTAFRVNKGEGVNADDREHVRGLAREVMAATTVTKPTEEEARRAQRLGEHLVRVIGPQAAEVLQGLARTSSSKLLDVVAQHAQDTPWSGLTHKQKQISRTEAAVAFTNLVPPTVEQRLLSQHGIDLNNEKDQNDLLDLVEDFHDGRSNATLMQMNKLLTAPVVKAMGLYLGNKIQPRLRGEEAVAQEHESGTTKTTDSDTEGTSGGRLINGELMGEQSEAPSDYEAAGQEKSMDRVMPESMVFHHSGNKDGSIRDIKDAWKEDAKGELPQLLREGTGAPLLDRVKKLAQQAVVHLGAQRDRYVIGNPASKNPIEAAGGTSAKKLMDDTGMPESKRAQLLFRYLAKENKDMDVGELADMYESVAYLNTIHRKLTATVAKRESLSPSGEKLSIHQSAEINAPHIDYEKLADLAANPSDAAKVKELFKAGTISKYVGLAQIVHRAKGAAEAHLATLPGYSEYAVKMYAEQGRSPEFSEYVNDFFSQHYVVVAEQPTNRDHLQMSLPEFREMALKGKANLKAVELSVLGSSMNDEAREAERLRVEASMNLIRFKSSHSKAENGEVALPAHMLVEWVRKMRNAHETDGENAPTKSNSPTKQTESYKRDLMEGITTVMQNGLTDGLPWIINAKGEKERFFQSGDAEEAEGNWRDTDPLDPDMKFLDEPKATRSWPGSLPPSLDLDGITEKESAKKRETAALAQNAKAEEEAAALPPKERWKVRYSKERAAETAKNTELSQDDRDVQGADSVAAAEDEANGSETREEERANLKFMSSVMTAAADQAPRALTVGGAMNYAGRIAASLWRDYMTTGKRAEALARIMSYVRATDKEKFDEDASNDARIVQNLWAEFHKAEVDSDEQAAILKRIEEQAATTNSPTQTKGADGKFSSPNTTTAAVGSGMVGGQHYNFPLAALLTPRHMASLNPKDVAVMTMLRSRVASELLGMAQAKQIRGGDLGKLVNFLSGYTDKQKQDLLDKHEPVDEGQRAEWKAGIKNRIPWTGTRIYAKGRQKFLETLAKPYQDLIESDEGDITVQGARRTSAPLGSLDILYRVVQGSLEARAQKAQREQRYEDMLDSIIYSAGSINRDADEGDPALVANAQKAKAKLNARKPFIGVGSKPTEGSSSGKPLVVAKAKKKEGTQANGLNVALRSIAEPLGGGRSTERNTDGSIKATDEGVAADTAAVNEGVDKLAGVIGTSPDARKATPMVQKAEPLLANPPTAPVIHQAKETAKLEGADLILAPISTQGYAGDLGRAAQAEGKLYNPKKNADMAGKTLLVSVPGKGRGFDAMARLIGMVKTALDSGAVVRTDNEVNANRSHNVEGEGALRQALIDGGYVETPGEAYSTWVKGEATGIKRNAEGQAQKSSMATAIAKRQDYLNNPPAAYSTEQVTAIAEWAQRQAARVLEEIRKIESDIDDPQFDHDRYDRLTDTKSDLDLLAKAAQKQALNDKDMQEADERNGTNLFGGAPDVKRNAEAVKSTDQTHTDAFKEWYGDWTRHTDGRTEGLESEESRALGERGLGGLLDDADAPVRPTFLGGSGPTGPDGKPALYFHGSRDDIQFFARQHGRQKDAGWLGRGVYLTTDPDLAHEYARIKRRADGTHTGVDDQNVMPLYAAVKNPFFANLTIKNTLSRYTPQEISAFTKRLKEKGYDGVVLNLDHGLQELVAFEPGDVKSAIGNNGEFNGNDPRITRNAEVLTPPTAAQSAKATANPPKNIEVTAALAHFKRTLSDKVKVMLADAFPDMTHGADYNTVEHLARISTANPLKIMQLAYHESMHAFFDTVLNAKGHEEIKAMLQKAMSEPKLYARLKDMLRDSPEALADMERDPEERVAYAYQFWAAGMLTIAQTPATFFQKVQALMRRVFGAVADSEKALAMFEAFHKGELKEPSAAGAAMLKIMQTGEWRKAFLKRFDRQVQAVYAEVMANHLVGRNSESETARKINNMWYSNPAYGDDRAHEGVINRTQMMRKKYINRLRLALAPLKGPNADRDLKALGEALNAHTTPELAHVAKAKVAVQALLKQYHEYAREAGVNIGERFGTDGDPDYYTRVMDLEKLIDGKAAFTSMLMTKYQHVLKPAIPLLQRTAPEGSKITEIDVANAIHQMYIDHNGVDDHKLSAMREDGVLNPFFAASNERKLYWIGDADIAPFLNTDAVGTLTQYISQGVRAAEYTRVFGEGGSALKDMMARKGDVQMTDKDGNAVLYEEDGPVAAELKAAAEKQGLKGKKAEEWVARRVDDLRRSHGAYEGSLGKDISAELRNVQAGAMIYQTLRLLSLMIFSSIMDPNGIRVAGGTSEDMFNAYKRGFAGLWMNWKDMFLGNPFGSRDPDAKEMAALEAGVIDSDMELEEMGQVHSSEYSSGMTRHVSHAFFKAIGITQWDRDMRISAVDAARRSIVSSYNNEVPEHSPRWLKEIGLKREQVFINAAGDLIVSARELALKNGISRTEAAKLLEPTHLAINHWVNRAIVSPNSGLRPARFSDPHFAMFAQFKSFTYAFQETTLRYAMHEAEQGNYNSGAQLLRGIPIMIVADMTKAMVTGGGSLPGYMVNWTIADWVSHAINRSGIGGTGTFATDILGGDVVGTLAGPTVDHAVSTVGKVATGEVGSAITSSIPIVKQFAGGAKHVAAVAN